MSDRRSRVGLRYGFYFGRRNRRNLRAGHVTPLYVESMREIIPTLGPLGPLGYAIGWAIS